MNESRNHASDNHAKEELALSGIVCEGHEKKEGE